MEVGSLEPECKLNLNIQILDMTYRKLRALKGLFNVIKIKR